MFLKQINFDKFKGSLLVCCLLGFKVRAAIFQIFSDDEHEMDDKMNMKWWWNEKGMGHKDNRVDKFWLPLEKGVMGKVGQFSLLWRSAVSYSYRIPQQSSLTCEERGIFHNTVHHYGLRSGFPYYNLTTPAFNTPGVSHSTTWGIHFSCSVNRTSSWALFSGLLRQA